MKIGRPIDRSHEAAVVPSNLPMPRKKKLKYAFWAAVPVAVAVGVALKTKKPKPDLCWSAYFSYGTRAAAYRAVRNHVYESVRHFLRRLGDSLSAAQGHVTLRSPRFRRVDVAVIEPLAHVDVLATEIDVPPLKPEHFRYKSSFPTEARRVYLRERY